MNFRGREIQSEADIQWLIDSQVQEAIDIDYKSQLYGNNDEAKREMLRDITSLANPQVGWSETLSGYPLH